MESIEQFDDDGDAFPRFRWNNSILIPVISIEGTQPTIDYLNDDNTFALNISMVSPLDWAIPLYGYLMPCLVAITTVTNSFIMIVLSQRHLRTPTNIVLLSMAVTDLLTGCTSLPWFLYYYTLKGYLVDQARGLDPFWCQAHAYLFEILPSIFHTAAIWLTVFLAIQRYVYVCVPGSVHLYCTPKTTKLSILGITMAAFVSVLPEVAGKRRQTLLNPKSGRYECYLTIVPWVQLIGKDVFYSIYYWLRLVLHFVPCLLLLIFTYKLGSTIRQAEVRKKSWAMVDPGRKTSCNGRNSTSSSGRSLYATNRMLAVICSVFLLLEIPASMLYGIQFLMAMGFIDTSPDVILMVNRMIVIRNLLIVMASPIQFGIYCSMSEQFRLTVRQLFTSRLLFVAQAQATFHGGKRYSLILVDVDNTEAKKSTASMRFARLFDRSEGPRRKLARQASLQLHEDGFENIRRGGSMRPLRDSRKTVYRCRDEESNSLLEPSQTNQLSPVSNNLEVPLDTFSTLGATV